MSQDQVKRLSTLVAAHMTCALMQLVAICMPPMTLSQKNPQDMGKGGSRNPATGCHPTAFEQLRWKRNRRKPVPYELIRVRWRVCCAPTGGTGNYGRALRMAGRAVARCLPGQQKSIPYVSYEAVMHKREQRRKSLGFFVLMNW